ncbi:phosphonate ABC transporter ATP-binding protein [Calothrix brevissima NIES-22]|nr:phosphonate ABC transporter ATP-binding protein [Calothrix brevissima NIES-22]
MGISVAAPSSQGKLRTESIIGSYTIVIYRSTRTVEWVIGKTSASCTRDSNTIGVIGVDILVQGAKIILADEPIASLDPESARKVMELLVQLNRQSGITVIASLHQIQMVRGYFERAIALKDGEVMFDGTTVELNDDKLNEIYGKAAQELVLRGHGELLV